MLKDGKNMIIKLKMFSILNVEEIYCYICESNNIKIILTCEHCICRSCISNYFCDILNCPTCEQELTYKEKGFIGIIALLNFFKTIRLYNFIVKIDHI